MDRRIQAALFKYIGIFEAQMRSQYAQWMNYVSGEFAIYNPELFHRVDKYERSFANYKKELLRKLRNKEESNVSIFQGIEVMTLGTLSQLYSNTKSRIVGDEVAKSFGATKSELTSWCKTITSVRNKIAHFEPYFVLREIPTKPLSVKGIELFNGSVFYICVLLAHLLSDNCGVRDLNIAYDFRLWNDMQDLIRNIYSYDKAALLDLGIPENWNDILINASNDSILHALKMQ
jgi:abortive infection bacteriophage resistance protein